MLIEDAATLKRFTRVQYAITFAQAEPWLRQAEHEYLKPALGDAFYADLVEHYETSGSSTVLDEVLALAQRSLAMFAMKPLADVMQVSISDVGMHSVADENHKSAYQWQVNGWKQTYHLGGLSALEELLVYLDEHRDNDALENWTGSAADTRFNDCLLRTAAEFQRELSINDSRLTFHDLKPALRRATTLDLEPVLGSDFMADLLYHIGSEDSDSGSGEATLHDQAIALLRPALAHFAVGRASEVVFRRVNGGLMSTRYEDLVNDVAEVSPANSDDARRAMMSTGHALLAVAQKFLDTNASSLPNYLAGPGYRASGADTVTIEQRIPRGDNTMLL